MVTSATFLIDAESNLRAALKAFTAGARHDRPSHRVGRARNLLLVLVGTLFWSAAGLYAVRPRAARRDPRSLRHAGDRLHRVSRAGAAGGRGPGHLSADDRDADGAASSRVVRGFSFFGVSFVYVIFEDGTDIYWARSRVLEYLNAATRSCRRASSRASDRTRPASAGSISTRGGQDRSLAELRSLQDWYIRYALAKAEGVAEVASVGGFVKQYNVVVDPQRLRSFGIPLSGPRAIRASNSDVGGRTVEMSETEYIVRGRGYLKSIGDLQNRSFSRSMAACPCSCGTWHGSSSGRTSAGRRPSSTARARW